MKRAIPYEYPGEVFLYELDQECYSTEQIEKLTWELTQKYGATREKGIEHVKQHGIFINKENTSIYLTHQKYLL